MFGSVGRSFQSRWYSIYPWLEYSVSHDSAFCHPCRHFQISPDPTFTSVGFRDWKHALGNKGVLSIHSSSATHTAAMLNWNEYKKRINSDSSVVVQLDRLGAKVIADNRKYVESLMEGVLYCAEQGIALRGHDESESSSNPGNYKSLLTKVISRHSSVVKSRLDDKRAPTWLYPAFQNEIIHFLANEVRQYIKDECADAKYFTVMADETKDCSRKEQLSIVFRYIRKSIVLERFTGYTHATDLSAPALAEYIVTRIKAFGLNLDNCISQCYDGASVMSGCNAGVQAVIQAQFPQAVYVHCYAHRLNLVLVDVVKRLPVASNFFALMEAVYVFLSSSKAFFHRNGLKVDEK